MILTWLIIIPIIGGVLAWTAARWSTLASRWVALATSLVDFGIALGLWMSSYPGLKVATHGTPITEVNVPWVPSLGINFHLALDGLNLLLVLLTGLLTVVSVACSWREIHERVGDFHLALLTLAAAVLGTFMAFDMLLFFFFWEAMLVPMYFLIAIWGHDNRRYSAMKFFLFTFIGGLFVLLGVIGLYVFSGKATFDYYVLLGSKLHGGPAMLTMIALLAGFAVKLPIVPLHTWLPDAHTDAPTAGSVQLAGLLLKTGAYGMLRFAVPLFPQASAQIALAMMIIGAIGILYGASLAYAQHDFKRMVAYTSISHMGFIVLGIYAGTAIALQGVVLVIICHGLATGALFVIAGLLLERTGTREFSKLGGLQVTAPKLGGFLMFFAMASLGLPGLGNFAGEFLVLLGTFNVNPVLASISSLGLIASVIYSLWMVQALMFGPNEHKWELPDLSAREVATLGVLAALLLWLGLHPQPVINTASGGLEASEYAASANMGDGQ